MKVTLRSLLFSQDKRTKDIGALMFFTFWRSGLHRRFEEATGHRPLLMVQNCTIRTQKAGATSNFVDWHLDANFFGFDAPFWTVWAPFVTAGEAAAGLEFCLAEEAPPDDGEVRAFWRTVKDNDAGASTIGTDDLGAFFNCRPFKTRSDVLQPGDAYVFDQHVLHRTQVLPSSLNDRVAIEFRIASADHFPGDVDFEEKADFLVAVPDETSGARVLTMREHFTRSR